MTTAYGRWRLTVRRAAVAVCGVVSLAAVLDFTSGSVAHADAVAYLVNVTVRPGYNFANADAALGYGREICGKVGQGEPYADLKREVLNDFSSRDDYHATYLINQAVGELCPAHIWQLRQLAATAPAQEIR